MGFTFDDSDKKGIANPITRGRAEELGKSGDLPVSMEELIESNSGNKERIFPYIGGKDINDSPSQLPRRYVINFGQMSEKEARGWPDLMRILENRVKGTRGSHSTAEWWHFERLRQELYSAISGMDRILVHAFVSKYVQFAFAPTGLVYAGPMQTFALSLSQGFAVMQSKPHELWVHQFASSLEDRVQYTPTDCFETFPFPEGWETSPELEAIGREYYEYRARLMIDSNKGLTKTYNRFHDPKEKSAEIGRLRELHAAMDRAVLASYGWANVDTTCGFDLDWCEAEAADDASPETIERLESGRYFFESAADAQAFAAELVGIGKGLPWRYRWRPEVRDDVLARLLLLNKERAEAERRAGLSPLAAEDLADDDEILDGDDGEDDTDDDD